MKILDQFGKPIQVNQLKKQIATPTLTGVRNMWSETNTAKGLTPGKLAQILNNANQGDHHNYLTLAADMEERDPHFASVLATRKRAITGLEIGVESISESAHDQQLAEAVREITLQPDFNNLILDLTDAINKGMSVVEIIWNTQNTNLWYPQFIWRDPRFFQFKKDDPNILMLCEDGNQEGIPLPAFKFITHAPRIRSGILARSGIARVAALSFMCKAFTLADWMAFTEVFGMPIRLGKYGVEASKDDIDVLKTAVANIGTDAAAIIPQSMQIEFVEAANSRGGESLFENLCNWLDRQISKAVLGQTQTADDGSSLAQAKVHNEVRLDILAADAKEIQNTLNRDLVKPFIDLNFGVQKSYPRIVLHVPEHEDTALLVDALAKLVPLGLQVDQKTIRDKLGLPDPKDGDRLLGITQETQETNTALNQAEQEEPEDFQDESAIDWEMLADEMSQPLEQALDDSKDFDEFLQKLQDQMGETNNTKLIEQLALAAFKARVNDQNDAA